MADMETIAKSSVVNYFDPSQEKSTVRLAEGLYPVHVTKCASQIRKVRGKYSARVYNFTVKVAQDARDVTYQIEDINGEMKDVNGGEYIGREIRSQGIFFFLTPDVGDDFEANAGGNRKYMETIEALNIECPLIDIDIDGQKKQVKSLPELSDSDFLGIPVLAQIGLGKPWKGKDGVERQYFEVKSINKRKGEKIDVEAEDLPF